MTAKDIQFSVFTKPWRTMPIPELGQMVQKLGFDGIELPVRPGFQIEPQQIETELPKAQKVFAEYGVTVMSVAGILEERAIAGCAAGGVKVLRIMVPVSPEGYYPSEQATRRTFDRLLPVCEKYGVTIGVQNHCGRFVQNAMGLVHLLEPYDKRYIAGVLDFAHCALNGEEPELALDIIWDKLALVNLKNAFWQRKNGPEAEYATWEPFWTSGRQGLANWPKAVRELKKRQYRGVVCLTAEYSDEASVDRLIAEDIVFAKALFAQEG
ncbi:MAG: sugar phosphate isomerase/epimerase family protein [Anaerolineae bacterium]